MSLRIAIHCITTHRIVTISIITLRIMISSIMTLGIKNNLSDIMLIVVGKLCAILLNVEVPFRKLINTAE
jgi:hypothetical protein